MTIEKIVNEEMKESVVVEEEEGSIEGREKIVG